METLEFVLEPITPLFSAGLERESLEIRPPSIRGELRFWFRAMMGAIATAGSSIDLARVRVEEARVFGDQASASGVMVRVTQPDAAAVGVNDLLGRAGRNVFSGVRYLGYGLQGKGVRPGLNSRFTVTLIVRGASLIPPVLGAFWLWVNLGGLGARTRRGFGALRVVQAKIPDALDREFQFQSPTPDNAESLRKHLHEMIIRIARSFCVFAGISPAMAHSKLTQTSFVPPFSCFANWQAVMVSRDNWSDWSTVLGDVGRCLRLFRNNSPTSNPRDATPDYTHVVNFYLPVPNGRGGWMQRLGRVASGDWHLKNDALGWPIQYRSQSRSTQAGASVAAIVTASMGDEKLDRRASPLLIRPVVLGSGRFAVTFLIFRAEYLPHGAQEVIEPAGNWPHWVEVGVPPNRAPPAAQPLSHGADLSVLDAFLSYVSTHLPAMAGVTPPFVYLGTLP